jgi:hypothetical protein
VPDRGSADRLRELGGARAGIGFDRREQFFAALAAGCAGGITSAAFHYRSDF